MPESAELPSEAELIEFMHRRNGFDYDECQHGTYTGGPSHGEPYAMCERQGKALFAFLTAPRSSTMPVVSAKGKKLSKIVKQAATRDAGGYPDESLMKLAEELRANGL